MFKNIVQLFARRKMAFKNNDIVMVGSCFITTDEKFYLFEEAEQAIEYAYYWYGKTDRAFSLPINNGGYYSVNSTNSMEIMQFTNYIHSLLEHKKLPLIISNSSQSLTECIAEYHGINIGVVNINHRIDLVNSLGFIPMQAYASVLSKKSDVGMMSVGVYEDIHTPSELDTAKSMGVSWVNSSSFYSVNPTKINLELDRFLSEYETIALNINLKSIVRGMTIKPPFALDLDLVLSVIQKCISSKKTILLQLSGDTESLVFSKETKLVIDAIRTKTEDEVYAA